MQVTRSEYLAALRSGMYGQTQGRLRVDDDFCCLGVYCDLAAPGEWELDNDPVGAQFSAFAGSSFQLYFDSEEAFADTFGITDQMVNRQVLLRMSEMNDQEGRTFSQIADWLENDLDEFAENESRVLDTRYARA